MNKILETISKIGIVPVIKIEQASKAVPLAQALYRGGIGCAEVTFRTDAAPDAILAMRNEVPDMLVGAGTVITIEQAEKAIAAGAQFIVCPGFDSKILQYCIDRKVAVVPGCSTPSEVEKAIVMGLDTVKFFPAEAAGGPAMLKALSGPFGNVKFMPTGGVNKNNLNSYLDTKNVIACGGSWMVDSAMLKAEEYDKIYQSAKEAVSNMLGFRVVHVGINMPNDREAEKTADLLSNMFGFEKRDGNSSVFAGDGFEIMKSPYLGEKGHIAIQTNYIERAVYYLENQGYAFDFETAKNDVDGKLKAIYLKDEFAGFALHLLQKK